MREKQLHNMAHLFRRLLLARSVHVLVACGVVFFISTSIHAQPSEQSATPSVVDDPVASNLKALEEIFSLPETEIDLARAKLTIDQMLDPRIDIEQTLQQIDIMASALREQLPLEAKAREKLDALRKYLYQTGPWNDHQPFSYDLSDPQGRNLSSKLLPSYLTTRKGNCVSMPILFIILGQRIGLDVAAATAPEHVFVKYRDESGRQYNLETTSGAGFARDAWMRQQMPMTDQAIASGIYMRTLTKKETVVLMSETLDTFYARSGLDLARVELAHLQLKHDPTSILAVLHLVSVYSRALNSYRMQAAPIALLQPTREREVYFQLQQKRDYWLGQALALGWRDPTESLETAQPVESESKQQITSAQSKTSAKPKSTQKSNGGYAP